ncbi:MAG TPA: serine hydrolase domain-containing protein [Bryobacteraceae bacterium]|nr:serine hydrolase domain-containing protein [Bryobacteraceae bacterium]
MRGINRREFAGIILGCSAAGSLRAAEGNAQLDDTLRTGIAQRRIPAVVGMVANASQILYAGAFGTRDSSAKPVAADGIFQIASMTKAITTVAALQLVEQSKIRLEEPVSRYLPQLAKLQVLDGFDSNGKLKLRPATVPVTLHHLLTHTSGFCYDTWDGDMFRYASHLNGTPIPRVPPLMFEPGNRWQYGMSMDWAGRLVEAVSGMNLEEYFQSRILRPLGMSDTSYILPEAKFERLVSGYRRQPDGSLKQMDRTMPKPPKEFNGGGGLFSTAADYTRFMQMILGKGAGPNQARILRPQTVELMEINQIGDLSAGKMKSYRPDYSSDVDIQPGATEKWGYGFLINTAPYTGGRSAGSLAWAGLYNTFYWIDPARSLCAVLLMQFLPFVDREAVGLLNDFEHAVYLKDSNGANKF